MSSKFFRDVDTVAERRAKLRQTTDLAPGEVILWRGRPKRGFVLTVRDMFLAPVSLMVLWLVINRFRSGGSASGTLQKLDVTDAHTLFLLAAAIYLLIGRFVIDLYYRAHLVYCVTNTRVVTARYGLGAFVRSRPLHKLSLSLRERTDGRGTINLRSDLWWAWIKNWDRELISDARGPYLLRIKDARRVYEILRKAQAEALASQAKK